MDGRPLRIAFFSDSALPILNGVSVSIKLLVDELRNRGHSVHLFTSAYPGYDDPEPNTHRFLALQTPFAKKYPLAVPPFSHMLSKFRRFEFDLVHTHTPFTVGFVGMRWAQSHDLPVVSTYHTLYDKYAHYVPIVPTLYVRYKVAKHTNWYYNQLDHVVTPSESSKRWLLRHSVKTPITVLPTGVPAPKMIDRSTARAELGASPENRILLYVGRIAREKNLETLLRTAAIVFRSDPNARLWLVGDGPQREACSALAAELGIGDRVRFEGFVPREQVDRYYAAADLFVFSSMTETQGLVIVEAMTYGLPALVVRGGGAGMAIEPGVNGYLLPNEPESFAACALDLLRDDELYASLSRGAIHTSREYTVPMMTGRMLEVYESVLERREAMPRSGVSVR